MLYNFTDTLSRNINEVDYAKAAGRNAEDQDYGIKATGSDEKSL